MFTIRALAYDIMSFNIMEGSVTVASILESAGLIVTEALSWLTETVTTVVGSPLLLMFVILGLVGTGVGLMRRIIG